MTTQYTQDPKNPNASIPNSSSLITNMAKNVPNPSPIATAQNYNDMYNKMGNTAYQLFNNQAQPTQTNPQTTNAEARMAVLKRLIQLKSGNVGANTGLTEDKLTSGSGVVTSSDQIREAENIAQQEAAKVSAAKTSEQDAELADLKRQSEISAFKAQLGIPDDKAPTAPTMVSDYEQLRTERGVGQLESAISDINTQIANFEQKARETDISIEEGMASNAIISDRKAKAAERLAITRDSLQLKKANLIDELNTKNSVINSIMSLKKEDYQNSLNDYNNKFNQAIAIGNMMNSYTSKEEAEKNRVRDDARANISLIVNSVKGTGKTYDSLDESVKASLNKLALQSGMDIDILKEVVDNQGVSEIISTQSGYDADGNEVLSFIVKDANGNPKVLNQIKPGTVKKPDSESSTVFKNNTTGKEYDIGTVEGIQSFMSETGASLQDVKSLMDTKTKLTTNSIDALLGQLGYGKFIDEKYLKENIDLNSFKEKGKGSDREWWGWGGQIESEQEVIDRLMGKVNELRGQGLSEDKILKALGIE